MTTGLISPSTNIKELLVKDPSITNVSCPLANTEYSFTVALNTRRITLKARTGSKIQLAFQAGTTGTTFVTVHPGAVYDEVGFEGSLTIYFQCSKANEVVEIISWKRA